MFNNLKLAGFGHRLLGAIERNVKGLLFGCSMCGQCILRSTGLVCPMGCPKQMRNGPCGGCVDGMCEVDRSRHCVWHDAVLRAPKFGWQKKLAWINPPVDWRLWGTASWYNLATRRIDIDGHPLPLKESK